MVDQLLRTASQHSDSSGFAEDSTDCLSLNHLQVKFPIVVGTVINFCIFRWFFTGCIFQDHLCYLYFSNDDKTKILGCRCYLSIWLQILGFTNSSFLRNNKKSFSFIFAPPVNSILILNLFCYLKKFFTVIVFQYFTIII